jgi:hypothetical protein
LKLLHPLDFYPHRLVVRLVGGFGRFVFITINDARGAPLSTSEQSRKALRSNLIFGRE